VAVRLLAIEGICGVLHQRRSPDRLLQQARERLDDQRDRALLHQLIAGVLRHYFTLEADWSRFIRRKPDPVVQAGLLLGTLQLRRLHVAHHAAIHATVEAVKRRAPRAAALVNAVLRRVAAASPPARFKLHQRLELPRWLYARWRDQLGAEAVASLARAAAEPPPLAVAALAVAALADRARLIERWRAAGIDARPGSLAPDAILLPPETDPTALPGWSEGLCTVIDQSAQLAALALPASPGCCLDLCSAPGGKYALLHPRMGRTVALELEPHRLARWMENRRRLGLRAAPLVLGDACRPPLPSGRFPRIMLDAPCSASGLLRRHPDVKFLHDPHQIAALAERQRRMIAAASGLLAPGGLLAYAVCSIHREENEAAVEPSLATGDLVPAPLPAPLAPFAVGPGMARILPSPDRDGFFVALLQRPADATTP